MGSLRQYAAGPNNPRGKRHYTCKRLHPDSIRDSIRIVAADLIRDFIRKKISDSQVPSNNALLVALDTQIN